MKVGKFCLAVVFIGVSGPIWAADLNDGQDVYAMNCQSCHGANGSGMIPGTPDFTMGERLSKPDTALLESVRYGKGVMPALGGTLSNEEILDAIAFIRTLR